MRIGEGVFGDARVFVGDCGETESSHFGYDFGGLRIFARYFELGQGSRGIWGIRWKLGDWDIGTLRD